ncbi:APC family permease [Anaerovorax odorimutans]|uniref:APC family permease n=1 Tax=Anaerovorax odorimutans TaxID=109327 RepID=A0ABT1RPY3_9FIRM|nr:APC family permease [Anaerovorax odorimutans]MCQ4637223.1 APC family permease [Anaerovorax odorimutans]
MEERKAAAETQELRRVLKLPTLVCQGLAYLCPACVFMYFGIINQLSGGHFPLAIIIAGIAMTLTSLSYAKMCRKYPVAGSVYSYTSKSLGPRIGFLAGWTIMLDYFLLPMTCYLGIALYTNAMIPAIPTWVLIIAAVVFVAVCNYIGVGVAAFLNNINVVVPIIAVLATLAGTIWFICEGGGAGTLFSGKAIYDPSTFDLSTTMTGAGILAMVFVGFDSVTTYSEETVNPEKNMPRAVVIVCIGAAIEFFLVAYLMNCAWPDAITTMSDPDTATYEYYVVIGMAWMNKVFVIFNILASIGCCIAGQGATARILLGMGRDGFIPKKFFGYVHPKFKTPSRNILLSAAIGLTALIFQDSLTNAMSLVSFGALTGFILTNISVIARFWVRDRQRGGAAVWKYVILPAIAAAFCAYLWISLPVAGKIVGFSWLAVGVIFLAIKTKGFKELPPEMDL